MAKGRSTVTAEDVRVKAADEVVPGDFAVARRSFTYTDDVDLDRGEVFRLSGQLHDEKLVRLGYVEPVGSKPSTFQCRTCGKEFVDPGMRDGHGRFRHEPVPVERIVGNRPVRERGEDEESYLNRLDDWEREAGQRLDARDEQRIQHEDSAAPLYLDKTTATRA